MSAAYDALEPIDPRAAATGKLLAVTLAAALGMTLAPAVSSQPPALTTMAAPVERVAAPPVKIIGATPRNEACEAQVWPYIEGRCLARAAPPATALAATPAETTGAAPAQAPSAPPAALHNLVPTRAATAYLQLPPRRAPHSSSAAADAGAGDFFEEPTYRTPRRGAARRAYRERNSSRRHAFPFLFR